LTIGAGGRAVVRVHEASAAHHLVALDLVLVLDPTAGEAGVPDGLQGAQRSRAGPNTSSRWTVKLTTNRKVSTETLASRL